MENIHVKREKGWLYYVGKDGHVYRFKRKSKKKQRVSKGAIARQAGYLYYVDAAGRVRSTAMKKR